MLMTNIDTTRLLYRFDSNWYQDSPIIDLAEDLASAAGYAVWYHRDTAYATPIGTRPCLGHGYIGYYPANSDEIYRANYEPEKAIVLYEGDDDGGE